MKDLKASLPPSTRIRYYENSTRDLKQCIGILQAKLKAYGVNYHGKLHEAINQIPEEISYYQMCAYLEKLKNTL